LTPCDYVVLLWSIRLSERSECQRRFYVVDMIRSYDSRCALQFGKRPRFARKRANGLNDSECLWLMNARHLAVIAEYHELITGSGSCVIPGADERLPLNPGADERPLQVLELGFQFIHKSYPSP
jgi:hypothetical protein